MSWILVLTSWIPVSKNFILNIPDCKCSKGAKDCDSIGKCDCKRNYSGEKCQKCADGYDDFHNGCKAGKLDSIWIINPVGLISRECF